MRPMLFKILFFPLDLLYLTVDATIITWRALRRVLKKHKKQRCHFCQGEANQEANHAVRAVLKYQNKWMVKLLAPCIRFKVDGKRQMGFCKQEGYLIRPPAWVPVLALGLICFWVAGLLLVLWGFSSDRENFGKNFISTFAPSTLGEVDGNPASFEQTQVRLNPDRAERYFYSGLKHFDKQEYPDAQVDFKIATQADPTKADYHFHLAKTLQVMGQNVQAEKSVQDTLAYDAEHVEALLMLAQIMEGREKRGEAIELAAKALALEPDNLSAIRVNAGLLAASGEKEKTRALMDQLFSLNGSNPDTLAFLGRLELSLFQDVQKAKERLQAGLRLAPDHIPCLLAMVSIHAQEGNLQLVDETLDRILELEPENLQALRLQAEMTLNRYGYSAGLRAYRNLLNRSGGNLALRLRYAELQLLSGRISEGKKLAQELTASREPQIVRAAHWMLAQMYSQVRMHEDAVQHARSALRLSPNGQNLHIFLAQQFIALNDLREAKREAEFALAKNPQDLRAVNLLSQTLMLQGEIDAAVKLLDDLLAQYPESDVLRMRRIEILMQSPRWREAGTDTRSLHAKYPDNPVLRNNLAFLLARSGEDLAKAEALSAGLAENFSDNPVIMDTRAYVLAALGRHQQALEIYEQALSKAGDNVVIRMHYAQSLAALDRKQDAIRQLRALLMINPDFPQAGEARTLLQSLTREDEA